MLEAMLDKLQVQAAAISGLQDKVNRQQLHGGVRHTGMKQLLGHYNSVRGAAIQWSQTRFLKHAAGSVVQQAVMHSNLPNTAPWCRSPVLQVSTLECTHLDSSQLLERVRLLEGRLGSISAAPLSPFNQAELLARVQALEGRAAAAEEAAQQLKFSVDEVRLAHQPQQWQQSQRARAAVVQH
jgi:hypothetical protein